jgi:hypothetical protein
VTLDSSGEHEITANGPAGSASWGCTVVKIVSIEPETNSIAGLGKGNPLDIEHFLVTTDPAGHDDMATLDDATLQLGSQTVTARIGSSDASCSFTYAEVVQCEWVSCEMAEDGSYIEFGFVAQVDGDDGVWTVSGAASDTGVLTDGQPYGR